MWGPEGMVDWGWMGFDLLPMLLFWALAIAGIMMLVHWLSLDAASRRARQSLQQRFAKDELKRDQFLKMKADL